MRRFSITISAPSMSKSLYGWLPPGANCSSANVGASFGAAVTGDALDAEELGAAEDTLLGGSLSGVGVALLPQAAKTRPARAGRASSRPVSSVDLPWKYPRMKLDFGLDDRA